MKKKPQSLKTYKLTFQLTKHKGEQFELYTQVSDSDELTGYIENYANDYQNRYGTPIKCIKSEEIKEYPEGLKTEQEE